MCPQQSVRIQAVILHNVCPDRHYGLGPWGSGPDLSGSLTLTLDIHSGLVNPKSTWHRISQFATVQLWRTIVSFAKTFTTSVQHLPVNLPSNNCHGWAPLTEIWGSCHRKAFEFGFEPPTLPGIWRKFRDWIVGFGSVPKPSSDCAGELNPTAQELLQRTGPILTDWTVIQCGVDPSPAQFLYLSTTVWLKGLLQIF